MKELLIELDTGAKTSLYEQIYEYIRRNIMDGRLSCGERLPSARLLAEHLKISRSTVDAAYAQLVSEGYLQAKRCSGYYVCDIGGLYDFTGHTDADNESGKRKGGCDEKIPAEQEVRYNFLPGQIDDQGFAYHAWRKCAKEALADLESRRQLLSVGHPQGEYELRRAIAAYLYQARGVYCEPEQMVIGAGNEYLLQLLAQILGEPRRVAMESPTYLQAYHTFCNIGYTVSAVPVDMEGMQVDRIPDGITLAYVMPSHQFPLGTGMPLRRRLQLLAWAQGGTERFIIEDDYDSEFRYTGRPIPALSGITRQEQVVYLGTFSNSIMPSVRISYMVLPQPLLTAYKETCGFYASTVSKEQQMTVCRFLTQRYFERHLNKMRGIYKVKHDLLLQLLRGKSWVWRIYGDHAGLHLAVELACSLTEEEVIARARSVGICVQGMSGCYIAGSKKPDDRPILLLGFGGLTQEQIQEGIQILERCVMNNAADRTDSEKKRTTG